MYMPMEGFVFESGLAFKYACPLSTEALSLSWSQINYIRYSIENKSNHNSTLIAQLGWLSQIVSSFNILTILTRFLTFAVKDKMCMRFLELSP
ncbi:hypothetical protein EUGRSUZ_K00189 [Eucalyptus grandis]|uniref:Uncharacterized protein n=2 Tax=Eucalyptus grandis TaxID=71139 RepID=A0ACC3IPW5_EUCGR|nr:hypothetical protein EUGRSUZ_K00189 [Eucalyptus grandis]